MKNLNKIILILCFCLASSVGFALPPENADPDNNGTTGTNDAPAPIGNNIIALWVVGIGFAFCVNFKKVNAKK